MLEGTSCLNEKDVGFSVGLKCRNAIQEGYFVKGVNALATPVRNGVLAELLTVQGF